MHYRAMRCLAIALLAACGSSTPAGTCEQNAKQLQAWVSTLVAEGGAVYQDQRDVTPVRVSSVAPRTLEPAPFITAGASDVSYQGMLLGAHANLMPEMILERLEVTRELLARDNKELSLAVVVDEKVPWSTIAAIGRAATTARFSKLRFVFQGTTKLADPAPSWLDADMGPLRRVYDPSQPAPDLEAAMQRAKDPNRKRVFDRCPTGRALLDSLNERAGETGNRAEILASGIAAAYRECDCAEELGAVQRMLWELWNRGQSNLPHAEVVVVLDASAPRIEVDAASPWSTSHQAILERADRKVSF